MLSARSSPTVHTLMVVLAVGDDFVVGWGRDERTESFAGACGFSRSWGKLADSTAGY